MAAELLYHPKLLRNFSPLLSLAQSDDLARVVMGFKATEGDKNVKGIIDSYISDKD